MWQLVQSQGNILNTFFSVWKQFGRRANIRSKFIVASICDCICVWIQSVFLQTFGLLSSQSFLVWRSRSVLSTNAVSGCTSSSSRVTTTGGLLLLPPPPDPPTPPPCSVSSSSSSSSSSPASVSWLAESVQVDEREDSLWRSSAWVGTWRLISVVKDSTSGPWRKEKDLDFLLSPKTGSVRVVQQCYTCSVRFTLL